MGWIIFASVIAGHLGIGFALSGILMSRIIEDHTVHAGDVTRYSGSSEHYEIATARALDQDDVRTDSYWLTFMWPYVFVLLARWHTNKRLDVASDKVVQTLRRNLDHIESARLRQITVGKEDNMF